MLPVSDDSSTSDSEESELSGNGSDLDSVDQHKKDDSTTLEGNARNDTAGGSIDRSSEKHSARQETAPENNAHASSAKDGLSVELMNFLDDSDDEHKDAMNISLESDNAILAKNPPAVIAIARRWE